MEDYVYNDIVQNIAQAFERELGNIDAVYNFDYGDEFEIQVCKFLRRFLPLKYGICRGFIVDKHGNKAGDDIIIYDQELYPTLRFLNTDGFAQKEQIPVEAVYAYIEAKYTLTSGALKKAVKQVGDVKRMCYSRFAVPRASVEGSPHIFNNEYSKLDGWNPIIANPVYGMILSANCVDINGKRTESGEDTTSFLINEFQTNIETDISNLQHLCFDSIIAGRSTTAFCGHYLFDKEGKQMDGVLLTRFYTGIKPDACYQINTHTNMAFGLAIAHLMMALNFIHLGDMPWDYIFNTAKMPDREARERFENIVQEYR